LNVYANSIFFHAKCLIQVWLQAKPPAHPRGGPSVHRNPERGFRCPYRCLSALPWPEAHPCGHVRAYRTEHQSGYRWSAIHRLDWDAGAL